MGLSKKLKDQIKDLSEKEMKKLSLMAWDDKTSYQEINKNYNLGPNEVEKFMCFYLEEKDYKRWRVRQGKRSTNKGRQTDD